MSREFKPGVLFGQPVPLTQTKKETIMDTSQNLVQRAVAMKMAESHCTLDQAKLLVASDAAKVGGETVVPMREAPPPAPRSMTLSERTRSIMKDNGLSFAAAQRVASKALPWQAFRGRP